MKNRSCHIEKHAANIRIYIKEEGEIVAGLEVSEVEQGLEIDMVFVMPGRRGQGLAHDLVTALREHFPGWDVRCSPGRRTCTDAPYQPD